MQVTGMGAIVTGGASGLGGATARLLASRGAKVAIFDLNGPIAEEQTDSFESEFYKVDVADAASVSDAIAHAESKNGVARVLVNCAGVGCAGRTVGKDGIPHSLEAYRRTIEVNLIGTFNMISQFAARLASWTSDEEERGVIINTASVAAFDGQVGQAAYASSKAGIVGLTLPVARDLAIHHIRVVTIAPGLFLTPMLKGLPQDVQDSLGKQVPHPSRLGRPEEFAQLAESIVANPMLNGEVIRLDGAIRMAPR